MSEDLPGTTPTPQPTLTYARAQVRPAAAGRKMREHHHFCGSVPSYQFQALFNSLFKVLCIFPSRYLFAIGLPPVFSFRWNLPPASGCTPKQPDSTRAHRTVPLRRATGFSPSPIPRSKGFWRRGGPMAPLQTTIQEAAREWPPDFRRELCPLHSPLLGASLLVSFPPLSDMLKFSG